MGLMSAVVIPLVLEGMREKHDRSMIPVKTESSVTVEQERGSQNRQTQATTADVTHQIFETEFPKRTGAAVGAAVAGGLASGISKGLFNKNSRKQGGTIVRKDKKKDDNNDNKRPPSGPSATPIFGQFTEEQIQRAKDFFNEQRVSNLSESPITYSIKKRWGERSVTPQSDDLFQLVENRPRRFIPLVPGLSTVPAVITLI